ncbi:TnsD family Tn7-like transposition protein [Massilia sp. CT11-108]|uniref:TnsD family Tn7-like transposition protein n=1 Tax=Massilia sp. CT11-108 TaxID=3393900 RepID=UPI0039A4479F
MKPCSFPYVPKYIEGELLFSWVSRLHFLNARNNPRRTLSELFGSSTGIPSADIPCRLNTFIDYTAAWGPFVSPEAIATAATLFPYYGLFLPPERYQRALDALKEDRADGLKLAMGMVANGFGASTMLRSCLTCDQNCMDQNGCVVLYRMHQLPGVLMCPVHGEPLCQHLLQSRQSHRQQLVVPARVEPFGHTIRIENPHLHRIAVLSSEALVTAPMRLSASTRTQTYLQGLAKHGFLLKGRVDWVTLANAIRYEYGDFVGLPFRNRLLSSERFPMRWLYDLCRRPSRSLHPLCHLLLIGLLFSSVRNFVSIAVRPAVVEPTSCYPGRGDYKESRQNNNAIHDMLINHALTCRKVALELGVSTTTVVLWRRALGIPVTERRKSITNLKLDEVKQLLEDGSTLASVAAVTGLSLSSVNRILRTFPALREARKMQQRTADFLRYRTQWLNAQASDPIAGIKKLRVIAGAAYAWLYRHDRGWLIAHIAAQPRNVERRSGSRVDWPQRDRALAEAVTTEAARTHSSHIKGRISATSLLRATGLEASSRRNIEKLPILKQAIAEHAEDDEAFCKRRRALAEVDLASRGYKTPAEWRIQRASGIRKRTGNTKK